jgi:hypothetical protein
MTSPQSLRSAQTPAASLIAKRAIYVLLLFAAMVIGPSAHATTATTTALSISSTSVPYKTPITLTATVTANGSPVTSGLVLFCDATATYCENNSSLLGMVQLTSSSATAVVKIGSGPQGVHSYKAVYRANNTYSTSTSNTVSYTVQGTYASDTALASSGSVGNYTLAATVTGIGSVQVGPSGTVSFIDTSAGNNVLGTQTLGPPVLSNAFSQAPNSPFAIGDGLTATRTVAIASAYLNGDNNLDVITGDADQVITVLLGNGDGTFQSKVNYAGCQTGKTLKIQLADFNRDGTTDIALGCSNGSNGGVAILMGNGNGSFQTPVYYATGDLAGLAMGDFNGDGILDLAATDKSQQDLKILVGNGNGSFQAPATALTTPKAAHDLVVADFNRDGKDDLGYSVSTAGSGSTLSDLYAALGNGDATFQAAQLQASQIGEFLTSGDTNGDNIVDIVSSTVTLTGPNPTPHISNSMFVLIGNGDGTFKPTVTYVSDIPSDPHLTDVNGDGKADIIAGGSYGALVYPGNGDGTFQAYSEPIIGGFSLTYAVNAGDYNNDGNADLIGTDANSPRAAVALSEVQQSADAAALTGVAVFPLGSGLHNVDASYSGDSVFLSSISSTVPLRAAAVPTSLSLSVSPSSGMLSGQALTLTATLSPFNVTGPPSTTTDGKTVNFYNGATLIGTGSLNSGVATFTTSSLPAGTDALKAVFSGTVDYGSSTSSVVSVTISDVLLASSPNPSDYLQLVTLTATVASSSNGTITFKDGGTTLGTATISNATASMTTSTLTPGSHALTAVYSKNGNGNGNTSTSPTVTQVVNKITPSLAVTTSGASTYLAPVTITAMLPSDTTGTVTFTSGALTLGTATVSSGSASITTTSLPIGNNTITASYSGDNNYNSVSNTTTRVVSKASPSSTITSSANPANSGATVTFTDTLPTSVTGTVTFTAGPTVIGTSNVVNGIATISTSTLSVGNTTITATYNGDGNNNTSVDSLVQAINKGTPSMSLTSSANPSLINQSVTLTATLPNAVTGSVAFSNGGNGLGTSTVTNGIATFTTSNLPLGANSISAQYSGDGNYNTASASLTQTVNKATPTITVTTPGPSIFGNNVTITATVPSGVTGSIVFTSGATSLGTVTISSNSAFVTTSILPVGSNTITASYGGDSNNNAATGTVVQVVNKASPLSTLTSSLNPAPGGASVTLTDTLPTNVTGTVTFTVGATNLGTSTVTNGVATLATTSLPGGSHIVTATYNGDSNNNTSVATLSQAITQATPTISVSSSPNPSTYGQPVSVTAQLTSGVTGTVTFTSGATSLGTGTVNGSGAASISTTILPVGTDTITAVYSGDNSNSSVTGTTSQVVNKVSPTMTLVSSLNPAQAEQSVTFTATLSSSVTGTVTFSDGATVVGTTNVSGTTATFTTTTLPVGAHNITATYNGDANNNTATAGLTETINKATPTVTVTTSGPSTWDSPVTITASVPAGATGTITITSNGNPVGSGTVSPAGTVTVTTSTLPVGTNPILASYSGDSNNNANTGTTNQVVSKATPTVTVTTSGPSNSGDTVTITTTLPPGTTGTVTVTTGGTTIGTATVNPSTGTATVTTSTLPVGTDPITSTYGGDSNNNPATGTTTQTVNKLAPTVAVTSSLNPSSYGQSVTFTATLSNNTATGTITFSDGANLLGTAPVSGGSAAIATSALNAGTHTITATYSGDTNWGTATGSVAQTVDKLTPVLPPPAVSNPNIPSGTSETITETVPPGVSGPVTFYNGGTPIGTAPIVGGVATITVNNLPFGTNPITASTPGDTNNNPATSPATTVTVSKSTPTVTLISSINPSAANQAVVFTATLSSAVTGTVTFTDGATVLGTATVTNSQAAITANSLTAGAHTIVATYGGDSNYNQAASAPLTQTVDKATPSLPPPSVSNPTEQYGGTETITETVPPGVSGPVTFYNGSDPIGTAPIINGTATITVPNLPIGSNPITATTPGDANNNPATSPVTIITVTKTTPVLPPPAVSNPNPLPNTPVTITETVPPGVTGPVTFTNGGTVIGTAPVVNGTATITVPSLPIGSNPITASVAETTTSNAATSPATTVTVDKTTPVLPPPAVSNSNPAPGTPVTITETVPAGVTGPVTFSNGSTPLGTAPVVNGVATITVPSLPIGSNPITASVAATATSNAATSPATTVTVGMTAPTVTLGSSLNPAPLSQAVTFTATLSANAATGTITFRDGSTVLGTGNVNGGIAVLTTSTLAIGTHTITATYGGDTAYSTATSGPLSQVIGKLPTNTVLSQTAGAQVTNSTVTFTATVSATVPTPTGTVTFLDGTTVLGTAALNTNGGAAGGSQLTGTASITISTLAGGSHIITAVYSGDNSFLTSTSAPLNNAVHDFTITNTTTGVNSQGIFPGDSTSYKFTLTPTGTTTFINDVNLTIAGLPEGSTYTFSPANVANGAGTTAVTLNVKTSDKLQARNSGPQSPASHGSTIALGMLGLLGLGTARRYRRRMPKILLALLLMAGSLLPVAALTGCAGGYFTLKPTTYTVTVTGTEGTIQHSATATLVVQ